MRSDGVSDLRSASTCASFLQWALPRLGLSWPGYRRVHRQVCGRIGQRVQQLHLGHLEAYRRYLEEHPDEWAVLDGFCPIPISRFLRDRPVFERLADEVFPVLAAAALGRSAAELRCWSAGCASGEEPYGLNLLWCQELAPRYPMLTCRIVATDVDAHLLERARDGRYRKSSLREVPPAWVARWFRCAGDWCELVPEGRAGVEFLRQDLRSTLPGGPFDLVLCRNLAFTYFDPALQRRTLERLLTTLRPGGALVIGRKERLPEGVAGVEPWLPVHRIYRRAGSGPPGRSNEADQWKCM